MSNVISEFFGSILGGSKSNFGDSDAASGSDIASGHTPEVWLRPDSDELCKQTLMEPRKIQKPVFTIGRRASGSVNYPVSNPPDFLIFETAPYTLSKLHCKIEIHGGQVFLHDLGSRSGTKLGNKRLISKKRKPSSLLVPKGSHTLILGHRDGPFRFCLEVS